MERENGIFNLYLDTLEKDGKVIFLKKVRNGKAKKSFGIYVAKLAGIPNGVLERAVELLEGLESKKREIKFKVNQAESQPLLFVADSVVSPDTKKLQDLENSIKSIPIEKITPLEALQIIDSLQKKL